MRKFFYLGLILISFGLSFTSCKKGCTDRTSLTFDVSADKDDGSCAYSQVSFYASTSNYYYAPYWYNIMEIDITVDGEYVGTLDGPVYPHGPGNCNAIGTVPYIFTDGESIGWNSDVTLHNGSHVYNSGSTSPSSNANCIKVNVTR